MCCYLKPPDSQPEVSVSKNSAEEEPPEQKLLFVKDLLSPSTFFSFERNVIQRCFIFIRCRRADAFVGSFAGICARNSLSDSKCSSRFLI